MSLRDKWNNTIQCLKGESFNEDTLRSVKWRVQLSILPSNNIEIWDEIYESQYLNYEELKRQLIVIPQAKYGDKSKSFNPLAPEKENPWTQYFHDQELRKLILLDVSRTFPEKDFFRQDRIHEFMAEILFLYCKQNPKLSYRQGMHELLAPILYVISIDSLPDTNQFETDSMNLLNQKYLPSQAYFLFIKLMSGAASFYELPEPDEANRLARAHKARSLINQKKNSPHNSINKSERIKLLNYPPSTNNPILKACYKVYYEILKESNPILYQHFEKLEIEPQLFGLRWFRLLFSREFTFDQTLILWDGIFENCKINPDSIDINFTIFIAVVMLFYIHNEVIDQDYSITLHKLMRFPKVNDVKLLITLAKTLSINQSSGQGYKVLKQIYQSKGIHLALLPMFPNTIHPIIPTKNVIKNNNASNNSTPSNKTKPDLHNNGTSEQSSKMKETNFEFEFKSEPKSLTEIITSDQLLILELKNSLKVIKEINKNSEEKYKNKLNDVITNLRKNIIFIKNRMIYLSNQPEYLLKENWTFIGDDSENVEPNKPYIDTKDINKENLSIGKEPKDLALNEQNKKSIAPQDISKEKLGCKDFVKDQHDISNKGEGTQIMVKDSNNNAEVQGESSESGLNKTKGLIEDINKDQLNKNKSFKEIKNVHKNNKTKDIEDSIINEHLIKEDVIDKKGSEIQNQGINEIKVSIPSGNNNIVANQKEEQRINQPKEKSKLKVKSASKLAKELKEDKKKLEAVDLLKIKDQIKDNKVTEQNKEVKKANTESLSIKGQPIDNEIKPVEIGHKKLELKLKSKQVRQKYDFLFGDNNNIKKDVQLKPKNQPTFNDLISNSLPNVNNIKRDSIKYNPLSELNLNDFNNLNEVNSIKVNSESTLNFDIPSNDDLTNNNSILNSIPSDIISNSVVSKTENIDELNLTTSNTTGFKPTSIDTTQEVFDNPW